MTAPEFEALRERRRELAHRLRADGLSLRAIADQLGVSHPTVIDDLRGPAMTAPTAAAPAAARPRRDEIEYRLTGLFAVLGDFGLTDQFAESRRLLDRAHALQSDATRETERARTERAELTAQVAAGKLSLAEATRRLASVTPDAARELADAASTELRKAAMAAVRGDMIAVHGAIANRAKEAVRLAVHAGRSITDVRPIVRVLRDIQAMGARRRPTDAIGQPVDPWRGFEVKLPAVSAEAIQGDPAKMSAWSIATAAYEDLQRAHEVARALHTVAGGSSVMWSGEVDRTTVRIVEQHLPSQVWFAVFAEFGWQAGLFLSLKPQGRRPIDVPASRGWQAPQVVGGRR